jgi:SAM-dependent methyltransferase
MDVTVADQAAGRPLDELDLFVYAMRLGAHLLGAGRLKRGLRYLVEPVHYWRGVEYRLVWNAANFIEGDRVLDVGSPKLLALYLAERVRADVFATDLSDYFLDEFGFLRNARRIPASRLRLEVEDGRRLSYPDATFTKAYSISVIEHVPGDGDSECMREIGRVLRPGGVCLVTVPFAPESELVYRAPDFYWAASMPAATDGRVFYYRRYSEADLYARLVRPSGLSIERMEYVGERVLKRSGRELTDFLVPPTGPIHPLLSRLAHTGPTSSWRKLAKPLAASLVLVKPS